MRCRSFQQWMKRCHKQRKNPVVFNGVLFDADSFLWTDVQYARNKDTDWSPLFKDVV